MSQKVTWNKINRIHSKWNKEINKQNDTEENIQYPENIIDSFNTGASWVF